jgi:hypothetical protein
MPQGDSADDDLQECPICGTFLESEEANTHAESHFTARDPTVPEGRLSPPDVGERVEFDDIEDNGVFASLSVGDGPADPNSLVGRVKAMFASSPNSEIRLCHAGVQRFRDPPGDYANWTCGYRNLQCLLSALLAKDPRAAEALESRTGSRGIPDVPTIQKTIEAAWRSGLDRSGRDHFNGKLLGKKSMAAWIGATEIAVFLIHLGVRPAIFDFHRPADQQGNHTFLIRFVKDYFDVLVAGQAPQMPLYWQHQGIAQSWRRGSLQSSLTLSI